jgi:hypothetical protein
MGGAAGVGRVEPEGGGCEIGCAGAYALAADEPGRAIGGGAVVGGEVTRGGASPAFGGGGKGVCLC